MSSERGMPITAEMEQLANDPNFVVEFAIGEPIPNLIPQSKESGIIMSGVFFDEPKRYIIKNAHLSKDDSRIFDVATGKVVMVSHHPGKNPYGELDPLGLGNTGNQHAVQGGEWESSCDVTACHHSMPSFKIRPKSISRHGRQYIKKMHGMLYLYAFTIISMISLIGVLIGVGCLFSTTLHSGEGDDAIIMNIGKKSKLSTQSLRPHFEVGRGSEGSDDYTIIADMMERTYTIKNDKDEVVAQVAKTTKAMIQTAVFGSGSEVNTIVFLIELSLVLRYVLLDFCPSLHMCRVPLI